jgi:hypothetical protein
VSLSVCLSLHLSVRVCVRPRDSLLITRQRKRVRCTYVFTVECPHKPNLLSADLLICSFFVVLRRFLYSQIRRLIFGTNLCPHNSTNLSADRLLFLSRHREDHTNPTPSHHDDAAADAIQY